jgi:hypothetical protein
MIILNLLVILILLNISNQLNDIIVKGFKEKIIKYDNDLNKLFQTNIKRTNIVNKIGLMIDENKLEKYNSNEITDYVSIIAKNKIEKNNLIFRVNTDSLILSSTTNKKINDIKCSIKIKSSIVLAYLIISNKSYMFLKDFISFDSLFLDYHELGNDEEFYNHFNTKAEYSKLISEYNNLKEVISTYNLSSIKDLDIDLIYKVYGIIDKYSIKINNDLYFFPFEGLSNTYMCKDNVQIEIIENSNYLAIYNKNESIKINQKFRFCFNKGLLTRSYISEFFLFNKIEDQKNIIKDNITMIFKLSISSINENELIKKIYGKFYNWTNDEQQALDVSFDIKDFKNNIHNIINNKVVVLLSLISMNDDELNVLAKFTKQSKNEIEKFVVNNNNKKLFCVYLDYLSERNKAILFSEESVELKSQSRKNKLRKKINILLQFESELLGDLSQICLETIN